MRSKTYRFVSIFHQSPNLFGGLLLSAFFFLLYLKTLTFGFVGLDDSSFLLGQPHLFHQSTFLDSIRAILSDFPREEPLVIRDLSWAIDAHVFGFYNPFGYHLGNVLLNSLNSALVFIWLVQVTGRRRFSFWVSLLHFSSPICVEPVAWIMERKGLLSTSFVLLSLISFTSGVRTGSMVKKVLLLILSVALTACAVLSKINALMIPGVMLLILVFDVGSISPGKKAACFQYRALFSKRILLVLPHIALCLVVMFWYFDMVSQTAILTRHQASNSLAHFVDFLVMTPYVIAKYMSLLFTSHQLSIFFTWPGDDIVLTGSFVVGSAAVALGLLGIGLILFLKRQDAFFFFACFFVFLFPYLEFIDDGLWIANRYLYLSGFPVFALCLLFLDPLLGSSKWPKMVIGWTAVILLLIWNLHRTHVFTSCFRSPVALFENEISQPHPGPRAFSGLARATYDLAKREPDSEKRNSHLVKTWDICNRGFRVLGLDSFQPSPRFGREHAALVYYRGLTAQHLGMGERILEEHLRFAEEIYPQAPAVLKELSFLYFQRAKTANEERAKKENAEKALSYLNRYFDVPQIGHVDLAEKQSMIDQIKKEFPFLEHGQPPSTPDLTEPPGPK